METGGHSVVVSNGDNKEYLKDGINFLLYKLGDLDYAVKNKERLISDGRLKIKLNINEIAKAKEMNLDNFKSYIIISLFDNRYTY